MSDVTAQELADQIDEIVYLCGMDMPHAAQEEVDKLQEMIDDD